MKPMHFILCGLTLTLFAAVRAWMDGARDDEGFVRWLMEKPLPTIFLLQAVTIIGIVMLVFGFGLSALP